MKKIALIGSGISSAATIFFLRQKLADQATYTVFEKGGRIGGRMKNAMLGGGFIEQGGTIYHTSNLYIQEIMAHYQLDPVIPHGGDGEGNQMGIWDGNRFRLQLPKNDLLASLKILLRYNFSFLRLRRLVKEMTAQWSTLYDVLAAGEGFKTSQAFYERLGLYTMTQIDAYSFFRQNGIGQKTVEEFIDCVSRVNYAQDGRLNALADMVSLAGAGLDGGKLYSVGGGNDQLAINVLAEPDVTVHLNRDIAQIESANNGTGYEVIDSAGQAEQFDVVVVGCPLDLTELEVPYPIKRDREYQKLEATFIAGRVNPTYFGLQKDVPNSIYTVENDALPWLSLSKVSWSPEHNLPIFKIFSRSPMSEDVLAAMFTQRVETVVQSWRAYTKLPPTPDWPEFEIGPNLYYPSAMESSFSSIEGQAVAARIVANLILNN